MAYHARRLGRPPDERCNRRYDWDEIQRFYDAGHTITECQERFGFSRATWNDARKRGAVRSRPQAMPIEKLLVGKRNRLNLKRRLLEAGLKTNECEACGISDWLGAPLSLCLHHVNGQKDDNRLENLRLLCPNCHSQTDNFGSRNKGKVLQFPRRDGAAEAGEAQGLSSLRPALPWAIGWVVSPLGTATPSSNQQRMVMSDPGFGPVNLLQADPELGRGLDAPRAREASQRLVARGIDIPRGPWAPARHLNSGSQPIGFLIIEGLLLREATVADHPCAELLGPGDLIRISGDDDQDNLLPRRVEWSALVSSRVAVVDHALAVRAAQWPEIFSALIDRAARRAERLVIMQAIAHLTRVDDRLLALLWCLAERWGRVIPGGVLVNLRLPHRTLASMIGARRPSVTTALGQLIARGDIERRPEGGWVLRGAPPESQLEPTGATFAFTQRSA